LNDKLQTKNGATNVKRLIVTGTVLSLVTESLHGVRQEVEFYITGQNLAASL
jgi:hypothetical protein